MDRSFLSNPRKLRRGQSMNTSAARYQNSDVREFASTALGNVLAERNLEIKEAANEVGCAPKTLENLLAARNGISVELLREMARQWPEMRPAIRAFFFLDSEIDPDVERMLHVIMDHARKKVPGK